MVFAVIMSMSLASWPGWGQQSGQRRGAERVL